MDLIPNSLKRYPLKKSVFSTFPQSPGVYFFWKDNTPIYIGKSVNLKARLLSYLALNLSPKTFQMVSTSKYVTFVKVESELEALLLEARLIHAYQPKYNFQAKDDKHPIYIIITKEKYPTVKTARKIDVKKEKLLYHFGPFPNSTAVNYVLKTTRRLFPFSDHKLGKKPCLYSHIGLCNPCPNAIEKTTDPSKKSQLQKRYLKNIKSIDKLLNGKINLVKKMLQTEMKLHSGRQEFEEAGRVKKQIEYFEYVTQKTQDPGLFLDNPSFKSDLNQRELKQLSNYLSLNNSSYKNKKITHIECFDVAHLSGTNRVASMVTFVKGESDKSGYKHFKLTKNINNDYEGMVEIAHRRVKHLADWGKPDLLLIDGGKQQVKAFYGVFKDICPVIGFAKNSQTLVIPTGTSDIFIGVKLGKGPTLNLVLRIVAEAHRFAQRYHHTLIKKGLLDKRLVK